MLSTKHIISHCVQGLVSTRTYTALRPIGCLRVNPRALQTCASTLSAANAVPACGFSSARIVLDSDKSTGSEWKGRDVSVPKGKARLDDAMIEDILLTFDENDTELSDDESIPKGQTQRMNEEMDQAKQANEPNLAATEALSSNPLTYVNPKTGEIGGPRGPEPQQMFGTLEQTIGNMAPELLEVVFSKI